MIHNRPWPGVPVIGSNVSDFSKMGAMSTIAEATRQCRSLVCHQWVFLCLFAQQLRGGRERCSTGSSAAAPFWAPQHLYASSSRASHLHPSKQSLQVRDVTPFLLVVFFSISFFTYVIVLFHFVLCFSRIIRKERH